MMHGSWPPPTRLRRGFVIRDAELVVKLDALVERERRRHPGRRVTRESLARELLHRAADGKAPRRVAIVAAPLSDQR